MPNNQPPLGAIDAHGCPVCLLRHNLFRGIIKVCVIVLVAAIARLLRGDSVSKRLDFRVIGVDGVGE
jgi:hypothetical protein